MPSLVKRPYPSDCWLQALPDRWYGFQVDSRCRLPDSPDKSVEWVHCLPEYRRLHGYNRLQGVRSSDHLLRCLAGYRRPAPDLLYLLLRYDRDKDSSRLKSANWKSVGYRRPSPRLDEMHHWPAAGLQPLRTKEPS